MAARTFILNFKSDEIDAVDIDKLIDSLQAPDNRTMQRVNDQKISIHSATYLNEAKAAERLLKLDPAGAKRRNEEGWLPMHYAVC